MEMAELDDVVSRLPGVRRRITDGLLRWELRGRLVARQLDATSVVVRVPFEVRDILLSESPEVFSVPSRFAKHMSVVADLSAGDGGAVEEAVVSAWRLQTDDASADV